MFKYGRCVGKIYKPHILEQIQNINSCIGYTELARRRKNGKTNNY